MMHMSLYWGKSVTLLINSWETNSWVSYALSLLACLVVSAFYQRLESLRFRMRLNAGGERGASSSMAAPELQTLLLRRSNTAGDKVAEAVLFGVNSAIGYLLMLAVMSFNGGVFVAIVVGLTLGYFFFRCRQGEDAAALVVDNNNSCSCA